MSDLTGVLVLAVVVVVILVLILSGSFRTIRPYEVGVLTLLGSYKVTLRPGFNVVHPLSKVQRVDLRLRRVEVGPWELATANGRFQASASLSFRVTDPPRFVFQVADVNRELSARTRAIVAALLEGGTAPISGFTDTQLGAAAAERLRAETTSFGIQIESILAHLQRTSA